MTFSTASTKYENLYAEDFQGKLQEKTGAIILDVRTPEEFESGRIPQSININIMDTTFLNKVSAMDKSRPYFVYCRSGARSGQACTMMSNMGFEVYNLAGGIMHWSGEMI